MNVISIQWAKPKYATEEKNWESSKERNCIEHNSRTGFNVIQRYSTIKFTFSSLFAFFLAVDDIACALFFRHFILDNLRILGTIKRAHVLLRTE